MARSILNNRKISDVDLSFEADPNTGDIRKLSQFAVIRRNLERIMTLQRLEKPFQEEIGGTSGGLLFEITSTADISFIESEMRNVIERHEPRVEIKRLGIDISKKNQLDIRIEYLIKDTQDVDSFTTFLSLSE